MIFHPQHTHSKHPLTRAGSMLIEMVVALGLLTAIGLILLKGTIDVMAPRNWIIVQNMADSYLTYEEAYAKRVSFDELTKTDPNDPDKSLSDWGIFDPEDPEELDDAFIVKDKTIGILPGPEGKEIKGTIARIRIADSENILKADETDYAINLKANPAKMETWKLQSILTYTIGGKDYVKTRTVVRTR